MGKITDITVKITAERWFEDRLHELGKSRDQFIHEMAMAMQDKFNSYRLTTLLNHPERATAKQIAAMATLLGVEDWYIILVEGFGFGVDQCTVNDFNSLLRFDGYEMGRVQHAA